MNQQLALDFKKILEAVQKESELDSITSKQVKELYRILVETTLFEIFELSYHEKRVIELRWKKGNNLNEISANLDLSRERISQIYAKVLVKLKYGLSKALEQYKEFENLKQENENIKGENYELRRAVNRFTNELGKPDPNIDIMKVNLFDLDISVRLMNGLKAANVRTIGDLMELNLESLLSIKNFGRRSLNELNLVLRAYHLSVKDDRAG